MKVKLVVVQGKPKGFEIPITTPKFLIGRGEQCHLRPNSDLISRQHCLITVVDGTVRVRDLGSRNGTMVNGQTVTDAVEVHDGDQLQVGSLVLAFKVSAGSTASLTPPAPQPPSPKPPTPPQVAAQPTAEFNVEQWLLGDAEHEPPERPSGVFEGPTQLVQSPPRDEKPPEAAPADSTPMPAPNERKRPAHQKPQATINSSEAAANLLRQMFSRRK